MSRSDWAVHDFVRAGIEAKFHLERAAEERKQLQIQCKRIVSWVDRQLSTLFDSRRRHNSLYIRNRTILGCLDVWGGGHALEGEV